MWSLRRQLLVSYLLLVLLMVLVMAGAVGSFVHLGRSIDRILKANYLSVIAAQQMKEALERQDSAATFFLAGQTEKALRNLLMYNTTGLLKELIPGQKATGEIKPVVQATGEDRTNRQDDQQRRNGDADLAQTQEVDIAVRVEDFHCQFAPRA